MGSINQSTFAAREYQPGWFCQALCITQHTSGKCPIPTGGLLPAARRNQAKHPAVIQDSASKRTPLVLSRRVSPGRKSINVPKSVSLRSFMPKNQCGMIATGDRETKSARRRFGNSWWSEGDLNPRHADFQSAALPTELPDHGYGNAGFPMRGYILAALLHRCKKKSRVTGERYTEASRHQDAELPKHGQQLQHNRFTSRSTYI